MLVKLTISHGGYLGRLGSMQSKRLGVWGFDCLDVWRMAVSDVGVYLGMHKL